MARRRRQAHYEAGELNMTAMIDIAFQLLSFFLVTLRPVDVFTHLDIFRPAPDSQAKPIYEDSKLLTVIVYKDGVKDGFVLQGCKVTFDELDRQLEKMAKISQDASLIIKCTGESTHNALVRVLDSCTRYKLKKLSVFSL